MVVTDVSGGGELTWMLVLSKAIVTYCMTGNVDGTDKKYRRVIGWIKVVD